VNSGTLWIKICGITRIEDALAAADAGAHAIGVNFVRSSRRYCDTATAEKIAHAVGAQVAVYGVFADMPRSGVAQLLRDCSLGGVQFHGKETAEFCTDWPVPALRAIRVTDRSTVAEALEQARGYRILLDSAVGGGSGTPIDEALVRGLDLSTAVVAGGLTPANVAGIVHRLSPWGVDVAGGVESAPGKKDPVLIREFIRNARVA
jgi:phosphoribosylanthranilate isomerase